MGRRLGRGALFVAFVLLASAVLAEIAIRATGLDWQLVRRTLYYQGADPEVHRASDSPGLLYELAPNTSLDAEGVIAGERPHDPPWVRRRYRVSINEHGARGAPHPEPKRPDAFRIHFHGASTLYGAVVDDDETIAASLERALRRADPSGPYEVWNYGTSGYVPSQMAILARRELRDHDPDLILTLHTNIGRRPFFAAPGAEFDPRPYFDSLPELWEENFFALCPDWEMNLTSLMPRSALARAVVAAVMAPRIRACPPDARPAREREVSALIHAARTADVPLLWIAAPSDGPPPAREILDDLPDALFWSLHQEGREWMFYRAHPAAEVLEEHGRAIAAELIRRGLVPVSPPPDAPRERAETPAAPSR